MRRFWRHAPLVLLDLGAWVNLGLILGNEGWATPVITGAVGVAIGALNRRIGKGHAEIDAFNRNLEEIKQSRTEVEASMNALWLALSQPRSTKEDQPS